MHIRSKHCKYYNVSAWILRPNSDCNGLDSGKCTYCPRDTNPHCSLWSISTIDRWLPSHSLSAAACCVSAGKKMSGGLWILGAVAALLSVHLARSQELSSGNADFASRLYRVVSSRTDDNVLLSPYSVSAALAMLASGCENETRQQLLTAIGPGSLEPGRPTTTSRHHISFEKTAVSPPKATDRLLAITIHFQIKTLSLYY